MVTLHTHTHTHTHTKTQFYLHLGCQEYLTDRQQPVKKELNRFTSIKKKKEKKKRRMWHFKEPVRGRCRVEGFNEKCEMFYYFGSVCSAGWERCRLLLSDDSPTLRMLLLSCLRAKCSTFSWRVGSRDSGNRWKLTQNTRVYGYAN